MADWDYRPEEEQKEEKEKKYVTRKEFRICFVILLIALVGGTLAWFYINEEVTVNLNGDFYFDKPFILNNSNGGLYEVRRNWHNY